MTDSVRSRHRPDIPPDDAGKKRLCYCTFCRQEWPCDAIQQADRADKAEAIARELAVALRDAIEIVHQTDSLRSHADPSDRTGWNRHGIETCEDATCAEGLAVLARYDAAKERP